MRALALAAFCACSHPSAMQPTTPGSNRGLTTVTQPTLPNVYARLRLTQDQPAAARREHDLEIWMKDSRFHVRDLAGRRFEEIEADLTAPRGLGAPARSMEDLMDRSAAARRTASSPTELFGDLAAADGWVLRANAAARSQPVADLIAVAQQILAHGKDSGLSKSGAVTLLGRAATEYSGTVAVTEEGTAYENVVRRVIAPPYLLLEELHDRELPRLSYRREVLVLEEGTVSDADVKPPAPP